MKMGKSPKQAKSPKMPRGNDEGGRFVPRDLARIDPKREQFEPTDAEPVRQRFKMAGGC
jgi:hypothetical protein